LLSFPVDTEMFHFSTFASYAYAFSARYPDGWVAPFGNPRITVPLPTPLGLSQVRTSFIASRCQVIHRAPLIDHTNRTSQHHSRLASTVPRKSFSLRSSITRLTLTSRPDCVSPDDIRLGLARTLAFARAADRPFNHMALQENPNCQFLTFSFILRFLQNSFARLGKPPPDPEGPAIGVQKRRLTRSSISGCQRA
jgi:hypothetical protein